MLKEYAASQHRGEPLRRWFADDYFDIIVWQDHDGAIVGFQLCYDKNLNERALTWSRENGFQHDFIDDGEAAPPKKKTPILLADGPFVVNEVMEKFLAESEGLEAPIRSFIIEKLHCYR
jgi:hypothetical protein